MTSSDIASPPTGFRRIAFDDAFAARNVPLHIRVDEDGLAEFGCRIEEGHANPMGIAHGGWIATVFDLVLPIGPRFSEPDLDTIYLLTVSISIDYLSGAQVGDWLRGRATLLKRSRRMVFSQALLENDAGLVARASGVFRIGPPAPPIRFHD